MCACVGWKERGWGGSWAGHVPHEEVKGQLPMFLLTMGSPMSAVYEACLTSTLTGLTHQ